MQPVQPQPDSRLQQHSAKGQAGTGGTAGALPIQSRLSRPGSSRQPSTPHASTPASAGAGTCAAVAKLHELASELKICRTQHVTNCIVPAGKSAAAAGCGRQVQGEGLPSLLLSSSKGMPLDTRGAGRGTPRNLQLSSGNGGAHTCAPACTITLTLKHCCPCESSAPGTPRKSRAVGISPC